MAITEDQRNQLHNAAREKLGREEATTLMELLPPVGWADVATKSDLDHLGTTLRLEMTALESRFETKLERELREQTHRFLVINSILLGVVVAVVGLMQALFAIFT